MLRIVMIFSLLSSVASPALRFRIQERPDIAPLEVKAYGIHPASKLEVAIRIRAEDAKALKDMTSRNIGQHLLLEQGDRVLAQPRIRTTIENRDFVVSFKNVEEAKEFQQSVR